MLAISGTPAISVTGKLSITVQMNNHEGQTLSKEILEVIHIRRHNP